MDYKFIVKGRGEGKTKKLVECLMDSISENKLCIYVGSYYNFINVKHIYEAQTHEPCPLIFIDNIDSVRSTVDDNGIDFFTDELTAEMGHILMGSLGHALSSKWVSKFEGTRWYITLDTAYTI